jgi:HlyD family secretion protein
MSGKLIQVAADLSHDPPAAGQNAPPYYLVRVSLPDDQVRKLGDLHLVPGMPAEAFIQTHARTPLQYLLKPLHDQITRTFRER